MHKPDILASLTTQGSYFLYDLDALNAHATKLAKGYAKLFFACKANPLSSVLSTLKGSGFCFDVASEGELCQVLSMGIPGNQIIMTGPAKNEKLLRLALEHKVSTFVIESPNQLMLLQKLVESYAYEPGVLLRLQLQWQSEEKSVLGGNQITHFGVDLETARELLPKVKLPFLGFHVFQWGNILSIDKLRHVWENTIKACQNLTKDFQVLDVGGGLGIPYKDETPLAWHQVNSLVQNLKQAHNIKEIWLEMGRYLTGPFGVYLTSVIDRKQTYGRDLLVLEGGVNHLARPALVNEAFPAGLLRNSSAPIKPFALHGPLCTSLDFLGDHMLPSDVTIGDTIIFKQAGAYGFTESMPFFLCHTLPGEAVIENGEIRVIREPAPAESWLK